MIAIIKYSIARIVGGARSIAAIWREARAMQARAEGRHGY